MQEPLAVYHFMVHISLKNITELGIFLTWLDVYLYLITLKFFYDRQLDKTFTKKIINSKSQVCNYHPMPVLVEIRCLMVSGFFYSPIVTRNAFPLEAICNHLDNLFISAPDIGFRNNLLLILVHVSMFPSYLNQLPLIIFLKIIFLTIGFIIYL